MMPKFTKNVHPELLQKKQRHWSSTYPRLKNNKRTFKVSSILFYSTQKPKQMHRIKHQGPLPRIEDPFDIVNIFVAVEEGTPWRKKNFRKKSDNTEKLNKGNLWGFSTSIVSQNIKKLKGGLFEENFSFEQKCLPVPKKTERGTLQSRPVLYVTREKTKNPSWLGSLGQVVQFDTIQIPRTL